jgi:hypothetical protein
MNLINQTGHQNGVSGPCGCYALAYCRDILDGIAHQWTDYSEGWRDDLGRYSYSMVPSKAGYSGSWATTKQGVLRALYDSINAGKPGMVHVVTTNGHYVAIVGYQNVTDPNNLSEANFLMIDSANSTQFSKGITKLTYSIHSDYYYALPKN